MPSRSLTTSTRRAWVGLMLVALLATQMLGLLHRVTHGYGVASVGASVDALGIKAAPAINPLQALFGQPTADRDCRLFDQLSHADMAGFEPVDVMSRVPADRPPTAHATWHLASQAVGAPARGPPALG
jgi:hypothetical protein